MSNTVADDPVVIVSGARTPMGGFQGVFGNLPAPELGAVAAKAAFSRAGIDPALIDEVMMGCVLPAGLGQAPARQVALKAGLEVATPCTTVNKMCGSGMKAALIAHDQILAGSSKIALAGGIENMSLSPYVLPKARAGLRLGHGEVKDHMFLDGLEDAYTGRLMGSFAQDTADQHDMSREDMDAYAITSLKRAQEAIQKGYFADEIAPVTLTTRKGEVEVVHDEQPGNANLEKIPQLKPAFKKDGTVTAANSSSISDGAAALVLMRESKANELQLQPMARVIGHCSFARDPSEFTIAPTDAVRKLLAQVGWSVADVDLFEVNEAFATVSMLTMQGLDIDHAKLNIHGGACALGHPIGASGARIMVTLMYALRRLRQTRGVASLCIGGGEATAVAIEMIG